MEVAVLQVVQVPAGPGGAIASFARKRDAALAAEDAGQ